MIIYFNVLNINTECFNDVYKSKHTFTHHSEVNPPRVWNDDISSILHIQHLLLRGSAPFEELFRLDICSKRVNLEGGMVNLTSLTWILTNRVWTIHEAHSEHYQSFANIVQSNCDLCDQFSGPNFELGAKPSHFEIWPTFNAWHETEVRSFDLWRNKIETNFVDFPIFCRLWYPNNNHPCHHFDESDWK